MHAGALVGDRRLGRALGRLAREDRARFGRRLDARSRVDEVAGNHPLVGGAERHRSLTGEDAGAGAQQGIDLRDRGSEVEGGPDGPFGVVLLRDRRTPDRHHGVADELLDRAAVPLDHRAGNDEIPAQELPRVLRVAPFGGGREADEVDEQHRHEPPLGAGRLVRSGG